MKLLIRILVPHNIHIIIRCQVYGATLDSSFWEGHTDTDINMLDSLIQLPIWQVVRHFEGC